MKKEIADKWVAALRSGEYAQDQGQLKSGEGFCCLGVLCDLHAKEYGVSWDGYRYQFAKSYTPVDVVNWAGLYADNGNIRADRKFEVREKSYCSLADANDGGATFEEIANFIEHNHEKL